MNNEARGIHGFFWFTYRSCFNEILFTNLFRSFLLLLLTFSVLYSCVYSPASLKPFV